MTPWERLPVDPWFPFEGDVTVKARQPPVVPEPPRSGDSAEDRGIRARRDPESVWADQTWALQAVGDSALPGAVPLVTRDHHHSHTDLPDPVLAALGPATARPVRAVPALPEVGRVPGFRRGDGSGHFHQWFPPRPLRAVQTGGSMLAMWVDLVPPLTVAQVDAARAREEGS